MINANDKYELIALKEEHFKELYGWTLSEKNFEQYTCRPVNLSKSYEEYAAKMRASINSGKSKTYILINKDNYNEPLGKINLFDHNPRNHSAEFGYYLPEQNRDKGLGKIMLGEFIDLVFKDEELKLNKIYATTASNNIASIRLLENFRFKLDGRMREHYWIDGNRYDQCVYSLIKNEDIIGTYK